MRRRFALILVMAAAALCVGCGKPPAEIPPAGEAESAAAAQTPLPSRETAAEGPAAESETAGAEDGLHAIKGETEEENVEKHLHLYINDTELAVDWEENDSVEALRELVSSDALSVQMSMYGGFEQVGPLGTSLPRNDARTTTQPGDVVLYAGNQIVIFYGSNSWAYTRLGRISDCSAAELAKLLGGGNVTLTIALE